jgi:hypothetical protein
MAADASGDQLIELFDEYDELADDVQKSSANFLRPNILRWLEFLDRVHHFARPILQELEAPVNLEKWLTQYLPLADGGLSSTPIAWPQGQRDRMGIQIALLRRYAQDNSALAGFINAMSQKGKSLDQGHTEFKQQLFTPLQRELRRYLRARLTQVGEVRWITDAGREIKWVNTDTDVFPLVPGEPSVNNASETVTVHQIPAASTAPVIAGPGTDIKRSLIPIENKRNFLDVSADIMEHVDPVFYGDPKTAAMKVLGNL